MRPFFVRLGIIFLNIQNKMKGSVSIDVELDDILWELSTIQKRDLFNSLQNELGEVPRTFEDLLKGTTANEYDLGKDLMSLWEDRNNLTPDQKKRIKELTKEKWV